MSDNRTWVLLWSPVDRVEPWHNGCALSAALTAEDHGSSLVPFNTDD